MFCRRAIGDSWDVYLLRAAAPDDVDRICSFLTGMGVRAIPEGGRMVCLSIPGALTSLHELRELSGSIATWNALNPRSAAELIAPE